MVCIIIYCMIEREFGEIYKMKFNELDKNRL